MDESTKFAVGMLLALIGIIVGGPPTFGFLASIAKYGAYDQTYTNTYIISFILLALAAFGIYLMRSTKETKP